MEEENQHLEFEPEWTTPVVGDVTVWPGFAMDKPEVITDIVGDKIYHSPYGDRNEPLCGMTAFIGPKAYRRILKRKPQAQAVKPRDQEDIVSGEVRVTSSTGGQKGSKPARHDLVPVDPLAAIATVFGFGAKKYADNNWRKGYNWSLNYAAMQRHLMAFWSGEDNDPESGLPHLAHAGFHVMALLEFSNPENSDKYSQFDDRYKGDE
jgi:hypothetical protein